MTGRETGGMSVQLYILSSVLVFKDRFQGEGEDKLVRESPDKTGQKWANDVHLQRLSFKSLKIKFIMVAKLEEYLPIKPSVYRITNSI